MIQFRCKHCGKDEITAPDSMAGKNARCPACKQILQIPAAEDEIVTAVTVVDEEDEETKPGKRPAKAPVRDGVTAKPGARRATAVNDDEENDIPEALPAWDEDDDDEEERRPRKARRKRRRGARGSYADCPECGSPGYATKVIYTWWGGFLGPLIFSLVQCDHCEKQYNGSTGGDNAVGLTIMKVLSVISIFVALAIVTFALIGTRMLK